MATKVYTEGKVSYGARGRRWEFKHEAGYQYASPTMPGGVETAHKVARIINGACKRSKDGMMDNLGRANMGKVFHDAARAHNRLVIR